MMNDEFSFSRCVDIELSRVPDISIHGLKDICYLGLLEFDVEGFMTA